MRKFAKSNTSNMTLIKITAYGLHFRKELNKLHNKKERKF